jgi:acyl dehydratase
MNPGDVITPLERTLELVDLVAYGGATWDWHPLHYDPAYLATTGLDAPVVDGQELGALMAEQVCDHFGPRAFPTHMKFRFASMVFAGETIRSEGTIEAVNGDEVTVAQVVKVGERIAANGTTTLRIRKA